VANNLLLSLAKNCILKTFGALGLMQLVIDKEPNRTYLLCYLSENCNKNLGFIHRACIGERS